jgi:hypothetical protein
MDSSIRYNSNLFANPSSIRYNQSILFYPYFVRDKEMISVSGEILLEEQAFVAPAIAAMTVVAEREDSFSEKFDLVDKRVSLTREQGNYFYFQPVEELDGAWVVTEGQRKLMFATYSYLGLLQHPKVTAASHAALNKYGVGTHGVRILGGTLDIHVQLEARIAQYTMREDAIVYSSGYVTNLATISTLIGRGDWVISDKWNHASIVDGCLLAQGEFKRFRHNDMADLERVLRQAPEGAGKLVVADCGLQHGRRHSSTLPARPWLSAKSTAHG